MSAIKTVNDAIKRLQDLVAEHPEAGEMPLYQQSCFDQPDTFQSSNLYLGQVFCPIIDDGTSSVINQRHCDPSKYRVMCHAASEDLRVFFSGTVNRKRIH